MFHRTILAALTAAVAWPAWAEITIEDAYFRTATPTAKTGAAFMVIHNNGPEDDRLVSVEADIAKRVELHTHVDMGDGKMKMQEVEAGFPVPAGGVHALERGGDHVMMMGLTERMDDGAVVPVTLIFEKAGRIEVAIPLDRDRAADHGAMGH